MLLVQLPSILINTQNQNKTGYRLFTIYYYNGSDITVYI